MPRIPGSVSTLQKLRAGVVRGFFANFFRLVMIIVSFSEWGVLWWVFGPIQSLPSIGHVVAPLAIYAANRALLTHTRRRSSKPLAVLPRAYYAFAFTCLFGALYLLLTGAVWMSAKVLVGALAVQASSPQAGLALYSTLDIGFRWLANAGLATIAVAFVYGYSIGQSRLTVARLRLPLRNFPTALHGLRIAQISDVHIGPNLDRGQLERFVARVNELQPDLICITGDIADGPAADLATHLPLLARLRAAHGVYAILGNHDHYAGADRVATAVRQLTPFTLLRDQHAAIALRGQRLHVIGLDDRGRDWARGVPAVAYLGTVLTTLPPDEPVVLLCHRPDIFRQAAAAGVPLTLAGHTHGGQLGVPWFRGRVRNLADFITDFSRGLHEHDGSYLYVNCGLGVTGQRIRLWTPREITLIEVAPYAGTLAA